MTPNHSPPPPRKAGKAVIAIVAVVLATIAIIFIGFNLDHAATQQERQSGRVDAKDAPQSPTDLQKLPPPTRQ